MKVLTDYKDRTLYLIDQMRVLIFFIKWKVEESKVALLVLRKQIKKQQHLLNLMKILMIIIILMDEFFILMQRIIKKN
jgi:hypothetical protein